MFFLHCGLVHPKCFQLCLSLVIGGGGGVDDINIVCIQINSGGLCHMGWSTIVEQLHSSVVSQQWNNLCIEHSVLIASCS